MDSVEQDIWKPLRSAELVYIPELSNTGHFSEMVDDFPEFALLDS